MTKPNIYILAVKRKGKNGERVTLHQRLYYNGEQWQTALGISVPIEDYHVGLEMVVGGENQDLYNRVLQTSKQTMKDILMRYDLIEHRAPTLDELTTEYTKTMTEKGMLKQKGKAVAQKQINIQDKIDEFIAEQGRDKSWSESTKKKFYALQKHLDQYRVKATFDNISEDFLYGFFNDYLCKTIGFANTTLQKTLKLVKWYLRWCNKKGYYAGNLHNTFAPKFKGGQFENKNIIFLTEEELAKLEEFEPKGGQTYLAHVRDVFLFSCYCGLRFSDVAKLKPNDIEGDVINVITTKTNDHLTINLNKHTRAILDKYKGYAETSGKCLPVVSNQKTNMYLHELCRVCGIDEPTTQIYYRGDKMVEVVSPKYELITFHAARRTFITHAARLGIPVPVIMQFSGHHSAEMLKPYLKIVDELKKKEMAKFDQM